MCNEIGCESIDWFELAPVASSLYGLSGSYCYFWRSRDSSVGIATGYGLDDRGVGVRVPVGSRMFFSSRRPDRFWSPPNLLSNGYRGLFSEGKTAGA
jgi:hypothetical protein